MNLVSDVSKWYVLHVVSGFENKVKEAISHQAKRYDMSDCFEEVVIPTTEVAEIKRGKQMLIEKKFMPGYIFIKMKMSDATLSLVNSIPKVTGFLGDKMNPKSLSDKEIAQMHDNAQSKSDTIDSCMYHVADKVQILEGSFSGFSGVVESVDVVKQKLMVSVLIFGRSTPVPLEFTQVKKQDS